MVRDNHKNNRNYNFNPYRSFSRFLSEIKKSIDALRKETDRREEAKENQDEQKKRDNTKWTDVTNLIINGLMVFFTACLFFVAVSQAKDTTAAAIASNRSANAAESTYREQKINDSIMRYRDSVKIENDSIIASVKFTFDSTNERNRFKLDSMSTQAQINSLKETQREFAIINKPNLFIANYRLSPIESFGKLLLDVTIENKGTQPLFLYSAKATMTITMQDTSYFEYPQGSLIPMNYPMQVGEKHTFVIGGAVMANPVADLIKQNKIFLFAYGEISFKDDVSGKNGFFRFYFKVNSNGDIRMLPGYNGIFME